MCKNWDELKRTSYKFNSDPVIEYKYPGTGQHEKYYQAALDSLRRSLIRLCDIFEHLTGDDVCRLLNDIKGEVVDHEIFKSNRRPGNHA